MIRVRYSEAFLNSLRMWHRPDQGTIVVHVDSFTPRVPLEVLLSIGRGTADGTGRSRELEYEARDWLEAAEITDVLIAYPEALRAEDLLTLERILRPQTRVWMLSFSKGRKRLRERLLTAGWQTSTITNVKPMRKGLSFGSRPEATAQVKKPRKALPVLHHRGVYDRHIATGTAKVERAVDLGLLQLASPDLDRWIAIASADHTGATCPFRLFGIVLKLATLERKGVIYTRPPGTVSNNTATQPGERKASGHAKRPVFEDVLASIGLTRIELSAIDVDQIAGRRSYVSLAGIELQGHPSLRIHARTIEISQIGQTRWLAPEHLALRCSEPDIEIEIHNPLEFAEDNEPRPDGRRISPDQTELEAILLVAQAEYEGMNFSRNRMTRLEPAMQNSISNLVELQILSEREHRYVLRSDLRRPVYRALSGTA